MTQAGSNAVKTEAIREALLEIASQNGGILNPKTVVDEARDPESVLHGEFEWNDAAAGERYRLAQAGVLIRRVRLTVLRQDAESRKVHAIVSRQFQSRPSLRNPGGGYEETASILSDPERREEMLSQVIDELAAYRKRYDRLEELSGVWAALDDVLEHPVKLVG
jgi:hypothetical protein